MFDKPFALATTFFTLFSFRKYCLALFIFLAFAGTCWAQPIDKKATKETKALYKNLQLLLTKGILFGHQDDLAYGVNWKYQPGRSDVKEVAGEYPGLYGWELGGLENDAAVNLDSVPFDKMKMYIRKGYQSGAAITISWHLNNPLTGKSSWDPSPTNTIPSILPGGEKNALFNTWLDKVAVFLQSLKTVNGVYIPVIFRPYHELGGNWFWWGGKNCTTQEYVDLWKYTVTYLKDKKNIHHLLYAFSNSGFATEQEFLERYPGNEWADIVGFDTYQFGDSSSNDPFVKNLDGMLTQLEKIAIDNKKIPALTEAGYNKIPYANWWTDVLYKALEKHAIAYVLLWRNAGVKPNNEVEYFAPYKGQTSAANFVRFSKKKKIFFQHSTKQLKLYH